MVNVDPEPFRFDWQDLPEDEFLKWLVPTLLAYAGGDTVKLLGELTNQWRDVQLGVTINGVEVDAKHFVASLQRNLTRLTEDAARDLLNDRCGLREVTELLVDLERGVKRQVRDRARQLGVSLDDGDEW